MDKNVLKKFAIESRQELMEKVSNKIKTFYVDEEFNVNQNGEIYVLSNEKHTLSLTKREYENRHLLIKRISEISLEQVIEEAAYTWFNRIIAIRYMEIHNYLPLTKDNQSLGIRVLSSKDNTPDPEIMKITNLINLDLDIEFNKEYYSRIQDNNKRFEYILLLICRKLGKVIPQVFDGVTDYIDILIPNNLLNDSGYITKLIREVAEENFNQVEIIGWLYQYYNQVEKNRVISAKKAYNKNEIPYATQLFTPDWIVKYMVENSLGRYWIEHKGNKELINNWKYYIKDENIEIKESIDPKDITCIDPCMGSGHILVYMFEVLYQIYESYGYSKKDIPELILKYNLFGLDIDDRAGQLSILSVILKAREYNKNIFNKNIIQNLNIMSIQESRNIDELTIESLTSENKEIVSYLKNIFYNAKEIGSLVNIENKNYEELFKEINKDYQTLESSILLKYLPSLIKQAKILSAKYTIVVTNPPYINITSMSVNLKKYVEQYYLEFKYDLFSAFIKRNSEFGKKDAFLGFMTPNVWMFISSYENLRKYMINNVNISSLIQIAKGSFFSEATVDVCSFILENNSKNIKGNFIRLENYKGGMDIQEEKYLQIINQNPEKIYIVENEKFKDIPNTVIAYWISNNMQKVFKRGKNLKLIGNTRQGMATSDNNRFLRLWFENNFIKIGFDCKNKDEAIMSRKKWFPYNKGGYYRKWYGNLNYTINYENDGYEVKKYATELYKTYTRTIKSVSEYFKDSISWSKISSGDAAFRYYPYGFIFDVAGCCIFTENKISKYFLLGFLNSIVSKSILEIISPTLNYEAGQIAILPILKAETCEKQNIIISLVQDNINLSKQDWDYFETSWDFKKHPLVMEYSKELQYIPQNIKDEKTGIIVTKSCGTLELSYAKWKKECDERFKQLKKNEENLNKIFIDIYGLQDELTPEVEDKNVTIRKADKVRDIKSLISYAIGCMFGRYSLNEDGLVYAGGEFDINKYKTFKADIDNIIPITENNYFENDNDIVSRFKQFIEVVYGKETLYENLDFIAETLGKRNRESSEDTIRRYFINDFYDDHVKTYQKRPIYWLFDSGKKNGFKCLIYMHRYNEGTVSKIRLDYLHRIQNTYEKELNKINDKLSTELSLLEKKDLTKKQADINAKLQETNEYDEKVAHIADQKIKIDLDDGVVVNYAKFNVKNPKTGKYESILAKIK